jgi:hypothetical protein
MSQVIAIPVGGAKTEGSLTWWLTMRIYCMLFHGVFAQSLILCMKFTLTERSKWKFKSAGILLKSETRTYRQKNVKKKKR